MKNYLISPSAFLSFWFVVFSFALLIHHADQRLLPLGINVEQVKNMKKAEVDIF